MRIAYALLLVLPLSLAACGAEAPPSGDTPAAETEAGEAATPDASTGVETEDGIAYGDAIGEAPLVALGDLVADTSAYEGKRVRVEGIVTDVCAKRGCWMNIGAEEGPEYVQFKVTDGVIVIPMSAKGGQVAAEGTVTRMEFDLETTKKFMAHKAEEAGEDFDEASVTEPMVLVRLAGAGAVIRTSE
jgi:hypothetical protein